jgi:hypothetical protein
MKKCIIITALSLLPGIIDAAQKETKQLDLADTTTYAGLVLGAANEYIYKPVMGSLADKSAERLEIEKLCKLLNEKINVSMAEFFKLGREAKELQMKGASNKELQEKHIKMADIFFTLRPAEGMVRMTFPKLHKLFDQLIELREELDYSIADTQVIIKDPAIEDTKKSGWFK